MGTSTLLELEALLSQAVGDWREFQTDTNITAGTTARIISTTLQNYDGGQDDYFNDWWAYISSGSALSSNVGVQRQVKNYETSAGRLDLRGAALKAETSAVKVRLHRFNRNNYIRALNRASEQLFPSLYIPVEDLTLVTGNILPNASFEDWAVSTVPDKWTGMFGGIGTVSKNTTAGLFRHGSASVKLTGDAAVGPCRLYISSDNWPRLLDLEGRSVSFYGWVNSEVADDCHVEIYTINKAGTTQTLTSTTTHAAGRWNLLKLEDQSVNADLDEIQLRLVMNTANKYSYFDDAIVCGRHLYEYYLPSAFQGQSSGLAQVYVQKEGYHSEPAYDLRPRKWDRELFDITDDGSDRFLRLREMWSNYRRIRLVGYKPLETLSADTDTISLDGAKLNLLIAQAAFNLYEMERGIVSSEDKSLYDREMGYWANKMRTLKPTLEMMRPSHTR